jgi:hypothetical protein
MGRKIRRLDVERGMEADFYCRCGVGFARFDRCGVCGCDYEDSVTVLEREQEARS